MTETQTPGKLLIHEATLRNVLSFGPQTPPFALNNLNVLIGPNGSGKSNFIEAMALLHATPGDIGAVFRRGGGGFSEWIWKGDSSSFPKFDFVIENQTGNRPLRHKLEFQFQNQAYRIFGESVENEKQESGATEVKFYYRNNNGDAAIMVYGGGPINVHLQKTSVDSIQSIMSQRRGSEMFPEISHLAESYEKVRIYRDWVFGRNSILREPQKTDMRGDRLEKDFSNLALILNRWRRIPTVKTAILNGLRDLYEGFSDFDVSIEMGTAQVFFTEGNFTIPASRLSDGTLRYLCLLAILFDPDPPPLICIEEPELGLHPDVLPKLAEHLIAASSRTQLIVTTHSDIIVDAMTERPESVVICEKHDGQTQMKRLKADELVEWLKKYRLGQLWIKGGLGGTRW